jgi:hypothetical protein
MRKSILLSAILGFLFTLNTHAQQDEVFKPNGKMDIRLFAGLSTTISDGATFNKFDVTRAYFGYYYNFTRNFTCRITYDFGNPGSGKMHYTGMLKYAYLQYHTSRMKITGGMFLTPQFEAAEKSWGFRYVYKTLSDEYGFGPTSDIGMCVTYNFLPWLSADAFLVNGEGSRIMEADSVFKAGISLNLTPVKNFFIQGYLDGMSKNSINQQTTRVILSYETNKILLASVVNHQKNHLMVAEQDYTGISLNGSLVLNKRTKLFARFDNLRSVKIRNAADPWNMSKDGNLYIAGIEYSPVPGIRFSPNYTGWEPAKDDLPYISRFSLNIDIRL